MKKTANIRVRHLSVNRETLRLLSEREMRPVIGGFHINGPTEAENCATTQSPSCIGC